MSGPGGIRIPGLGGTTNSTFHTPTFNPNSSLNLGGAAAGGFMNSLNNTLGPIGGISGAFGIAQGLLSGNITGTLTSVASTLVNFIPVVGPFLAPLVGPVIGAIVGWFKKRKAKKAAKKFKKLQQQELNRLRAENAAKPPEQRESDDVLQAKASKAAWAQLSPKEQERIQQYAGQVPACAEALRSVMNAESTIRNYEYNKLISGILNPAGSLLPNYNPNSLNYAYNAGSLLYKAIANDPTGAKKATRDEIKAWADINLRNANPVPSADDFDPAKNSQADIDRDKKILIKFAQLMKADPATQNDPLVKDLNPESLNDNAAAKAFAAKLDALEAKIEQFEASGMTEEQIAATPEGKLAKQIDRIEGELALNDPSAAVSAVLRGYGFDTGRISAADVMAASGDTLADKLANAMLAKGDANKDGALDRYEIMQLCGANKNIVDIYDTLESSKMDFASFKAWLESFKATNSAAPDLAKFYSDPYKAFSGR